MPNYNSANYNPTNYDSVVSYTKTTTADIIIKKTDIKTVTVDVIVIKQTLLLRQQT